MATKGNDVYSNSGTTTKPQLVKHLRNVPQTSNPLCPIEITEKLYIRGIPDSTGKIPMVVGFYFWEICLYFLMLQNLFSDLPKITRIFWTLLKVLLQNAVHTKSHT